MVLYTHTHIIWYYTHTHTVWYYTHTHTHFNKKMQLDHSTMPLAIYSVSYLLHMVEQLINSLSLILSKVVLQLLTSFSLLSELSSVCPTVLGSVSAICPSLQWLAVPLSVSYLSHHVISLSHHPCQLSVLLPTQLSTTVYLCQLSVLSSLSVISLFLLPPVSVISLSQLSMFCNSCLHHCQCQLSHLSIPLFQLSVTLSKLSFVCYAVYSTV